jgi:predicted NBD/HSP70 family sugar kinase
MKDIYIGVDLGGTRLRLMAADGASGKIFKKEISDSPFLEHNGQCLLDVMNPGAPLSLRPAVYLEQKITNFLDQIGISENSVLGIGMSLAGRITPQKNFMGANTAARFAIDEGNGFFGLDVTSALKRRFPGIRIIVENDANATAQVLSAYFEFKEERFCNVYYITISTGIGGGSVHLIPNEMGHMICADGFPDLVPVCGCGGRGCLEAYASGTGLAKRTRAMHQLLLKNPEKLEDFQKYESHRWGKSLPLFQWTKKSAEELSQKNITSREIFERASSSLNCLESYLAEDAARRIAQVCVSLTQLFGIEMICMGGGLVENNPWWRERISDLMKDYLEKNLLCPYVPQILTPPLGESISDYGAIFQVKKDIQFSEL